MNRLLWGWWIKVVLSPLIVLIGIIGNFMTVLVMKSKMLRHKSYSHYLCALALFDSLTLAGRQVTLVNEMLYRTHSSSLFASFSDAGCKLYTFAEATFYAMSSWLVVMMALERVVAVYMPFRKSVLCNETRAMFHIVALFLAVCYTQVFQLIMVRRVNGTCGAGNEYLRVYVGLQTFFYQLLLVFALPFLVVLASNVMIIRQVRSLRRASEDGSGDGSRRFSRAIRKNSKPTAMLLTISFTFLATIFPTLAATSVIAIAIEVGTATALELMIRMEPYFQLCEVLSLLNYAVNFFIYVLSGRVFRHELRRIFSRRRGSSFTRTRKKEELLRQ